MMINKKEKNFISAVVYVNNNTNSLNEFLPLLYDTLEKNFEKYEIVCVVDGQQRGAVEAIKKFSEICVNPIISIVNMGIYQGLELSMLAGVDISIGDFVLEFDNLDVRYTSELIMSVYNKSIEGNDIVMAVPNSVTGIASKAFYSVFNKNSMGDYNVTQDIFHIISRRAINRVQGLNKTIPYRKAIYSQCGLKCAQIEFDNVAMRRRKFNRKDVKARRNTAFETLALFTDVIQKISTWITAVFLVFSVIVGAYAFIVYFGAVKPVEGWTFTILFLSVSFFGVFLVLTIILKYIAVLVNIVFKKQEYLVDSVEKITND